MCKPLAATRLALTLFIDVILREAWAQKIDVLDLRAIAIDATDHAPVSPIEPSAIGARKIAVALAALLQAPANTMAARVFAGLMKCMALWHSWLAGCSSRLADSAFAAEAKPGYLRFIDD